MQQESITVGFVSPACQLYMLWPPDVSTDQVNKFGQVYSDCHQMSLGGAALEPVGLMSDGEAVQ